MNWSYEESHRIGDHIWYISDLRAFRADYPAWSLTYSIDDIFAEIHEGLRTRMADGNGAA
jgi:CDP-paratose 2-epimerase